MAARRQVTQAQLARWPKATKAEKSAILDAVCQVTGWHRDHARKAIREALAEHAAGGPRPRKQRVPVTVYGEDAVALLTRCWAALDGPTGKRLHRGGCRRCWRTCSVTVTSRETDPAVISPGVGDVTGHDRPPARRRPGRAGGRQDDRAHPRGIDAQGVDPMKTWAGVERPGAGVRPDRPGRPRGRRQQRESSASPSTLPTWPPAGPRRPPCGPRANGSSPPGWSSCGCGSRSTIAGIHSDYADLWVMPTSPGIALSGKGSGTG